MSDLHCPARLTLASSPDLLDARLRPAASYVSAAAAPAHPRERYDVLDGRLPAALDEVADRHRGEDVVVLLTAAELASLPGLPGNAGGPDPIRVDIDADGWAFRR